MNIIGGYIIREIISQGSFGKIYKCYSNDTKQNYALKIGKDLKYEANIYKLLLNTSNVSGFIDFFKYNDKYDCLVLRLYNMNLKQFKEQFYNDVNYNTYLKKIFLGVVNGIKNIHENGIIHRDIKPVNVCLNNNMEPFIIDLGMAKRIIINKKHIENGNIHDIIGTINYASINSINKKQLSRRDDIESFFYIYMYMILNDDKYHDYIFKNIKQQKDLNVINSYLETYNEKTCIKYIRNMTFTQKPNYEYILSLLLL